MPPKNLEQLINRYETALVALEEPQSLPSGEQVLAVLKTRDEIQTDILNKISYSNDMLIKIVHLDGRLKQQGERIAKAIKLPDWRASVTPPTQAWWWFFEEPTSKWKRFDWLVGPLAIIFLTISLSLVIDISTRFLSGGPDTWSTIAVIVQSALTLLAAGGLLTTTGREVVKRSLSRLKIPSEFWQAISLSFAVFVFVILLVLRLGLPGIARLYNDSGLNNNRAGHLTSAQFDYIHAIKLNPDFVEAHYNLGLLYEDLGNDDQARTEYTIAVQGGLDAAYNNLAHLFILNGNDAAAIPLLLTGLDKTRDDEVRYDLLKNLGWVRLRQMRYSEAETYLLTAIGLESTKAPAHCLFAQVLDGQNDQTHALVEWENCLKYASERNPDEDAWIGLARQRLIQEAESK